MLQGLLPLRILTATIALAMLGCSTKVDSGQTVCTDPKTGQDANPNGVSDPNPRFMFEVRVKDGQWWLDAFVNSKAGSKALIDPTKTHPINQWYAVAQTYDGKTYRSYVNGVLEGEADVAFTPHGAGHMMVGVRMNHVNWFKGSVAQARFSTRALSPRDFLKVPQ